MFMTDPSVIVIHHANDYVGFSALVPAATFGSSPLRWRRLKRIWYRFAQSGYTLCVEDSVETDRSILSPVQDPSSALTSLVNPKEADYNISVGYLRAFITVMVVAHHAVLAYDPFAPAPPASLFAQPRWWQAFPVVDPARWGGFGLFTSFNDIFFMSLMFFLSGLFVWNSLHRKGTGTFLRDRFLRLGLPFALVAGVIAPLAYYPAFLLTGSTTGLGGFFQQWLSLGNWPAGPGWFVWVLLAFDCVAVLLTVVLPKWGESLGSLTASASRRPIIFFALLVVVSAAAYSPMELAFNPLQWSTIGPFAFQTSRILHYLVYFLLAVGVGAYGVNRGLLAPDGKLARRWLLWTITAVFTFGLTITVVVIASTTRLGSRSWEQAGNLAFALSCAATCFGFLALFVHFVRKRTKLMDSLRDNAYGIFLVHYAFVSWLQYALLGAALPAFVKGMIVVIGAVALSWGFGAALRRVPAIARVV